MGSGQVVRHQVLVLAFGGSSPSSPARKRYILERDNGAESDLILDHPISIFIGRIGSEKTVRLDHIPYISNKSGTIGLPLKELAELKDMVGDEAIIWIKDGNHQADTELSLDEDDCEFLGGKVFIDFNTKEVQVDGVSAKLTPTQFKLLEILAINKGQVINNKIFERQIWGGYVGKQALRGHIHAIKEKLGQHGWIVKNKLGVGYLIDDKNPPPTTKTGT
jgi:hypothetical protein